jgi:hypothetical protein
MSNQCVLALQFAIMDHILSYSSHYLFTWSNQYMKSLVSSAGDAEVRLALLLHGPPLPAASLTLSWSFNS